jgi:hypothetical protein
MNSDRSGSTHAFVTFRVAGAALEPEEVTNVLKVHPTHAHRKGETYGSGRRGRPVTAKTGVWSFSTDRLSERPALGEHLTIVRKFLDPERTDELHELLRREHLTATLTCFWHGGRNATPPSVPGDIKDLLSKLPATIETDFATDE